MAQRLQSMDELLKIRHFEREIIVSCVRWYRNFKLNDRKGLYLLANSTHSEL